MKWSFTTATTSASKVPSDPGNQWQAKAWHLYISGTTGGAAGTVQIQYSPDGPEVTDAGSRWFAPAVLGNAGTGSIPYDAWFQARFRKIRAVTTGGDGSMNLVVEIV